ncbi:hypothetical protein [Helicobacter sp.]|uniref:hypothetical protein n=1 Tax=Helicobacter sp. TaxID=218 RepID=UPI00198B6FAC|nr:hypothetical protein [Helicobacter sp.]MBD5164493.1 hypothetical protein [Helicobacter sp.]
MFYLLKVHYYRLLRKFKNLLAMTTSQPQRHCEALVEAIHNSAYFYFAMEFTKARFFHLECHSLLQRLRNDAVAEFQICSL